jgi:hypothetical protein
VRETDVFARRRVHAATVFVHEGLLQSQCEPSRISAEVVARGAALTVMNCAGVSTAGTNGSGAIGAVAGKSAATRAPTATLLQHHHAAGRYCTCDWRGDGQERGDHKQSSLCGRTLVTAEPNMVHNGFNAYSTRISRHSITSARLQSVGVGNGADFGNVPDEKNAEFYSPPYLFKGPRPTISQSPSQNLNTVQISW